MGDSCPLKKVMTLSIDLLNLVQPADGWFAVVGIKGKSVKQVLVETREEVDQLVQEMVQDERDVYFGVAKYATDQNRQKDNVKTLKSFWIDIDCGESKAEVNSKTGIPDGYIDQATGLQALQSFCKHIGLPKPVIVNSGRGIHAYWPLTEEITREQWEPVAFKLRDLCVLHKLYVDPSVFEVARILRVPGTYNFKDNPPKPVSVVSEAEPVDFEALLQILHVELNVQGERPPKREMTDLAKAMMSSSINRFSKIIAKSQDGTGCQQLLDCYENRDTLLEPRWFDALSIAKFCVDKDTAIHDISEGYEGYDPAETEQKIEHILGPHTCAEFEKHNPGGCDGCPYQNKIKSPIVLGKEIEEADPEDNVVMEDEEVHKIPAFPHPFFRGKNGGVYYTPDSEEAEPVRVFEYDLYVVKRMRDPIVGDVVVMKVHLPKDGVREIIIPNTHVAEPAELKKALSSHGVLCTGKKQAELLVLFIVLSVKELQFKKKAEQMRLQFGWADNDSKFIVGDKEISVEGVYHSPPSSVTEAFAGNMHPEGTLEKWKEVFDLYNREGLEPHAFATLTSFGAPLLKFLGQSGAILNVIHNTSGTGKSTILYMCNSVWGHPVNLCGTWQDTLNAKIMRLGIMNNLPYTMDEITNMSPQDFSTLAYSMSQGRGKDRVKNSSNELRKNLTSWATISLCSSNASFYEKMGTMKTSPDGELMRLLEYKIEVREAIDPAIAKAMFDHQLRNNYGHAGLIYGEWLVNNLEEAISTCLSIQAKIDKELKLTQRERFWSAVMAANITGGLIAKQLGLISWDMKRIYRWATGMLLGLREDVKPPASDVSAIIGDYVNRGIQNTLVVNDGVDRRSNMPALPIMEPRGDLTIRYEPDTKMMYLAAKAFKNDCAKYQVNYKETLAELEAKGIFVGRAVKRLSKGMKVVSPGVQCLIIDCSSSEFLDMDEFIQPELEDAGGEG